LNTIEDCLETLDRICSVHPYSPPPGYIHPTSRMQTWDYKFISDVSTHTSKGSALSVKQAETLLKVLSRNIDIFDNADRPVVSAMLATPKYRQELYQSVEIAREVRWAGGSTILFRSAYNTAIVADIRNISNCIEIAMQPILISGVRTWKIIVDSSNYKHIMSLIQKHGFKFDDETLNYFMLMTNHADHPNRIVVNDDTINVEINNEVMASLWLESMEWLTNV
jgi:hypothetical protein